MRSILIAALLAAGPAVADDLVFQGEGVHIRLEATACAHKKVLDLLKPEFIPIFRNGFAMVRGKQLALCWTMDKPGEVTVIDEEGDAGRVPLSSFKVARGI